MPEAGKPLIGRDAILGSEERIYLVTFRVSLVRWLDVTEVPGNSELSFLGETGFRLFGSLMKHGLVDSVNASPFAMVVKRKPSADWDEIERHLVEACELATGETGLIIDDMDPIFAGKSKNDLTI